MLVSQMQTKVKGHGSPARKLVVSPGQLANKVLDCPEALLRRWTQALFAPECLIGLKHRKRQCNARGRAMHPDH